MVQEPAKRGGCLGFLPDPGRSPGVEGEEDHEFRCEGAEFENNVTCLIETLKC